MRGCGLVAAGEVLQYLIVVLDGLLVVALLELKFRQIKIGIPGKIGIGVELDVVAKFLHGNVIFASVVVAERVVVENVGRRRLGGRSRGLLGAKTLLGSLHIFELLAELGEANL